MDDIVLRNGNKAKHIFKDTLSQKKATRLKTYEHLISALALKLHKHSEKFICWTKERLWHTSWKDCGNLQAHKKRKQKNIPKFFKKNLRIMGIYQRFEAK